MTEKKIFVEDEAEFIPLLNQKDEKKLLNQTFSEELPLLTVKNSVLLPGVVLPVTAGRDKSIDLLDFAMKNDKIIAVVTQTDSSVEEPNQKDLYTIGTVAKILKQIKMPDGSNTVIIQGLRRFRLKEVTDSQPFLSAKIELLDDVIPEEDKEFIGVMDSIKDVSKQIINEDNSIPSEAVFAINNISGHSFLINFIIANINISVLEKQELLEVGNVKDRAFLVLKHLNNELQKVAIKNDIQSKVKEDIDQQQREYFLNQQMRQIQEELGENGSTKEIEEFQTRAKNKKWNEETAKHFDKEIARWQNMNPQIPEYSIQRNYLELFLDLPWEEYSKDDKSLKHAEQVLDAEHYGMEKIKKRILEHLAVLKLKNDMSSPIICLVGPPGVGKTSLGKSIAESLGREYVRMSLGGLHDESEIRGHRKTYIGAMPGRIVKSIKKAGKSNPVFVLDEIDKLGRSNHGDPSSALLEVLDPEQNNNFYDNYLDQGYDLSKVLFIATANSLSSIQPALLDRMEVIEVSGYTVEEKVQIAKRHLLPKQIKENGLTEKDVILSDENIEYIVSSYTRESGVRTLEKRLATVVRHNAYRKAYGDDFDPTISTDLITEILGKPYTRDEQEKFEVPGIATGLAWTPVGGDILFIESILSPGNGKFTLTGNLGEVMKESATIALEYIKANFEKLGLDKDAVFENNIHIHVPQGAIKKDGPSAGITMLSSLVSSYSGKKVRDDVAMTGEITLRGKVLPVGGIKEKILAAKRAGIQEIILCEDNKRDIMEIEDQYLKGLTFHYVKEMNEVLELALEK